MKVGKVIGLLAEEGDDISNLHAPEEKPSPPAKQEATPSPNSPAPQSSAPAAAPPPPQSQSHHLTPPSHFRPLFPSVYRLLAEHGVSSPEKIKGTGVRGMLTKGDVLAHLGMASTPLGTYKEPAPPQKASQPTGKKEQYKACLSLPYGRYSLPVALLCQPLDGSALRRLIVSTMLKDSMSARSPRGNCWSSQCCSKTDLLLSKAPVAVDFDSILADYLPPSTRSVPRPSPPIPPQTHSKSPDFLAGLI